MFIVKRDIIVNADGGILQIDYIISKKRGQFFMLGRIWGWSYKVLCALMLTAVMAVFVVAGTALAAEPQDKVFTDYGRGYHLVDFLNGYNVLAFGHVQMNVHAMGAVLIQDYLDGTASGIGDGEELPPSFIKGLYKSGNIVYNSRNKQTNAPIYLGEENTVEARKQSWGDVYYYYANEKAEEQVLYKTDLSFSYAEELFTGVAVVDSNDTCMILSFYDREAGGWEQYLYRPKTQEKTKLSWPVMKNGACNFVLSGKYVYYEDKVMGDELYGDPHRDYYDFTWDDVREMGNGDLIYDENQSAHTDRAGKLYRMDIETGETACVLQLTYKGIPVRIEEFEADGEVIYFSFKNHEEFKNFYNQEFEGASEDHYAIADLQNGTVIFLEFPEVE